MKGIAVGSAVCFILCGILQITTGNTILVSFTVTFGTISYHLCIRLLIGAIYNLTMNNHADYNKKWFISRKWEQKLYKVLRVKQWKNKMPTYHEEVFDPQIHSWEEIAQAMCQSELVHETNILISFFPIIMVKWFGSFWVFFMTSLMAALFDLSFVILQRYNRPRIVKLLNHHKRS